MMIDNFAREAPLAGERGKHDLFERARARPRQQIDRARVHQRKAGVDVWQLGRTLVEADHAIAFDAGVTGVDPAVHRETGLIVRAHEAIVIEAAEDIAVRHQKTVAEEVTRLADGAAGAERSRLAAAREARPEVLLD